MIFTSPIIETERLILRPLTIADADAYFVWSGDERVTRYMHYSTHKNVDDVRDWLMNWVFSSENEYNWGCVRRSDGLLIGSASIRHRSEEDVWSFGYQFRYDCWGFGYATETARRIIDHVYENDGARSFLAEHAVENPASGRVMEKLGMTFSRYTDFTKIDGSATFKAKEYRMRICSHR